MSMRIRWASLATAALIAAGTGATTLMTAGAANARPPGGCDWGATSKSSGVAICTGTDFTTFRVTVKCAHAGTQYTNYGSWERAGGESNASCNSGDMLATANSDAGASVFFELND